MCMFFFCFFFFSSRRRHTRCLSDWSSDVCSSDLKCPKPKPRSFVLLFECIELFGQRRSHFRHGASFLGTLSPLRSGERRSEERRVGKSVDLGGRRIIKKNITSTQEVST